MFYLADKYPLRAPSQRYHDYELPVFVRLGPDPAVLLIVAGILAIYAEFLAPGRIIPGVAGAAVALIGMASLLRFPVAWHGMALVPAALATLLLEAAVAARGRLLPPAFAAMLLGFRFLVAEPRIHWLTAFCAAVPLTFVTAWLLKAAVASRRAKRYPERVNS